VPVLVVSAQGSRNRSLIRAYGPGNVGFRASVQYARNTCKAGCQADRLPVPQTFLATCHSMRGCIGRENPRRFKCIRQQPRRESGVGGKSTGHAPPGGGC
jgi:hypothetical protein